MQRFEQSRYRVQVGNDAAAILAALRSLEDTQNPIHVDVQNIDNQRIVSVIYENTNYKEAK